MKMEKRYTREEISEKFYKQLAQLNKKHMEMSMRNYRK